MGLAQNKGVTAPVMDEFVKYWSWIFRPSLLSSLWWPQSSEIFICGLFLDHHMLAAISMHGHAPMLVPLIHAWSIITKSKKYIWFRQHHILMYVRNSSKKRKYLIVKLLGMRSCDRSLYVCSCRYNGCINRRDVHITKLDGGDGGLLLVPFCCWH